MARIHMSIEYWVAPLKGAPLFHYSKVRLWKAKDSCLTTRNLNNFKTSLETVSIDESKSGVDWKQITGYV